MKKLIPVLVCPICKNKGFYFVDEWLGPLQGRKDCKCKNDFKPTNQTK